MPAAKTIRFLTMVLLGSLPGWANLDSAHWVQSATRRTFNTRDGLVTSSISRIRQTRDGYLWIGGSAGLARFDGTLFVTFDQRSSPQFQSSTVSDMSEDREGTLWIATDGPILIAHRGGQFRAEDAGVPVVQQLAAHPDGSLYLGCERGLFQRRSGRTEPLTALGLPANQVSSIWVAPDGAVWVGLGCASGWRPLAGSCGSIRRADRGPS